MARRKESTKHPALAKVPTNREEGKMFEVVRTAGDGQRFTRVQWKENALENLRGLVPIAVAELEGLITHGQPDNVRVAAIRLLVQMVGLEEGGVDDRRPTPVTVNVGMFNMEKVDGKSVEQETATAASRPLR